MNCKNKPFIKHTLSLEKKLNNMKNGLGQDLGLVHLSSFYKCALERKHHWWASSVYFSPKITKII